MTDELKTAQKILLHDAEGNPFYAWYPHATQTRDGVIKLSEIPDDTRDLSNGAGFTAVTIRSWSS